MLKSEQNMSSRQKNTGYKGVHAIERSALCYSDKGIKFLSQGDLNHWDTKDIQLSLSVLKREVETFHELFRSSSKVLRNILKSAHAFATFSESDTPILRANLDST
jgi:hypothetical protein